MSKTIKSIKLLQKGGLVMARPLVTTSLHSTASLFPKSASLLAEAGIARHGMALACSLRSMRATSRPRPPGWEVFVGYVLSVGALRCVSVPVCSSLWLKIECVFDFPFAPCSGGSWITGSLYMNDFPTIKDLVQGNGNNMTGWLLHLPLATPFGSDVFSKENQDWYGSILWSVFAKAGVGV